MGAGEVHPVHESESEQPGHDDPHFTGTRRVWGRLWFQILSRSSVGSLQK